MIRNHENYGHFSMAENIAEYLSERFPDLEIDEPVYWESGRYIAVFINLVPGAVRMSILLTSSGKNQHVYNLKPMSESKSDIDRFVRYMNQNYPSIELKKDGCYAQLQGWTNSPVKNNDYETIAKEVERAIGFFN